MPLGVDTHTSAAGQRVPSLTISNKHAHAVLLYEKVKQTYNLNQLIVNIHSDIDSKGILNTPISLERSQRDSLPSAESA